MQTEGHGAEFSDDFIDCSDSIAAISERFSKVALEELTLTVPGDFLLHSVKAMTRLSNSGRSNVLYGLAQSIGTMLSFPHETYANGYA